MANGWRLIDSFFRAVSLSLLQPSFGEGFQYHRPKPRFVSVLAAFRPTRMPAEAKQWMASTCRASIFSITRFMQPRSVFSSRGLRISMYSVIPQVHRILPQRLGEVGIVSPNVADPVATCAPKVIGWASVARWTPAFPLFSKYLFYGRPFIYFPILVSFCKSCTHVLCLLVSDATIWLFLTSPQNMKKGMQHITSVSNVPVFAVFEVSLSLFELSRSSFPCLIASGKSSLLCSHVPIESLSPCSSWEIRQPSRIVIVSLAVSLYLSLPSPRP